MPTERSVAEALVKKAIAYGYTVSVHDGEEFPVMRSTDVAAIMQAMFSSDADTLLFRYADGTRVGSAYLVYGNAEDGSELVADYSDNSAMVALVGEAS